MKTIIPILAVVLIMACKKTETQPSSTSLPADTYKAGKIEVWITSNYLFPYSRINQGVTTATSNPNVFNYQENTLTSVNQCLCSGTGADSSEVYIKYQTPGSGKFIIYSVSPKNSSDSTKYMADGNLVWNRMVVKVSGKVVYDNKNTNNISNKTADNSYAFTLQ